MSQPATSEVEQDFTVDSEYAMIPDAEAKLASSAPKIVLKAEQLRPGTADLFGSSHPRNAFACKATTSTATVHHAGLQMAIDWSSSGIPLEVNRSLIKAGTSS